MLDEDPHLISYVQFKNSKNIAEVLSPQELSHRTGSNSLMQNSLDRTVLMELHQ